eukprot:COSAG01_NODE_9936_length_2298_cov_1.992724_2_plen_284_part_00
MTTVHLFLFAVRLFVPFASSGRIACRGKTVTSVAVVRDLAVRNWFHAIAWVNFGQQPVLDKLQSNLHFQLEGVNMDPNLSQAAREQTLKAAMAGRRILLCCDDIWVAEHVNFVNFIDEKAGSKLLISTRTRGLLGVDAHQIEVGLPTIADAIRIMVRVPYCSTLPGLSSQTCALPICVSPARMMGARMYGPTQMGAASSDESQSAPFCADRLAEQMGCLPLALGIAGRLVATLGLANMSWEPVCQAVAKIHEEARVGPEEAIMLASLQVRYRRAPAFRMHIDD